MPVIQTKIDIHSDEFKQNAKSFKAQLKHFKNGIEKIKSGGPEKAKEKHAAASKLLPRDRISYLLDKDSDFLELSLFAADGVYPEPVPAAGIITGIGRVNGQECTSS